MPKSSHTAIDVAVWMLKRLERDGGVLSQEDAAVGIESKFGEPFVRVSDSGGLSIDKGVLAEFRALTEKTVVWDRTERLWRKREKADPSTRLAD